MNPTPFPNLDLPFVDTTTGRINKGWYQLLASMYLLLGGPDPVSTPDLAIISGLMDENFAAAIEIEKGLDALATGHAPGESAARIAELTKALEATLNAMALHDRIAAQVAELDKRLSDMELSIAFEQQAQTSNALTGATTAIPPAGNNVTSTPAAPNGYLTLNIDGVPRQVPYY